MPTVTEKQDKKYGDHDDLGMSDDERAAEVAQLNDDFDAPAYSTDQVADKEAAGGSPAVSKADSKELDALGGSEGGLFNSNDKSGGKLKSLLSGMSGRRKKVAGGGILTGLIVALVLAVLSILPMKVLHVVNNLQQHFFASSEEATEKITDRLFTAYIVKKVMPGMHNNLCTTTRASKSCVDTSGRDNLISVLYGGWRDANLEGKLAENYGLEIRREGNKFYLRSDRLQGDVDLGSYDRGNAADFEKKAFAELSRSEVRREIKRSLANETRWKRVMYRFKVGTLMERKYGIVRCVIGCDYQDRLQERREDRKMRFKSMFIQRVVGPRNEAYALIMECAMSGFNCANPGDADEKGERRSKYETDLYARLQDYRKKNLENPESRQRSLAEIEAEAQNIREKGMMGNMIDTFVKSATAKFALKGLPYIGWIDLGARIVDAAPKAGPAIRHLTYVTNSVAMVETYMMYRSNGDEMKRGTILAEDLGEMAESFSPTDGAERKDQGGVGAEASPLYGALMGTKKTSAALNPFSTKAFAATSNSGYTCEDDDNKPVPAGQYVCNVERLDTVSKVGEGADLVSAITGSPLFVFPGVAADVWINTLGKVLDWIGVLVGDAAAAAYNAVVPDKIKENIEEFGKAVLVTLMGYVIKEPITDSMSGARNFNMAAGGADVAGNDFARYSMGGKRLTNEEVNTIRAQRKQEAQEEFKNMPLLARIFDAENPRSGVSQLAMALPTTTATTSFSSFANSLANPFGLFAKSFGSIQAGGYVQAATTDEDPFGVDQYGYTGDEEVFSVEDYEKYYDDLGCGDPDNVRKWGEKATEMNENTQMTVQNETNPCLLLRTGAGSAGALYTDEVLTDEELGKISSGGYTVMSYNVMGADKDGPPWSTRKVHILNTLKAKRPDIIGFQEMNEDVQFKDLSAGLPDYDMWDGGEENQRPIYWKKSAFEKTDGGIYKHQRYSEDEKQPAPWVKLKNKGTGTEMYVFNYHGIANDSNAEKKIEGAHDLVEAIGEISGGSLPVITLGDFNSKTGQFADPILKAAGFIDTYEAAVTKINGEYNTHGDVGVPTDKEGKHIDHIYIRPEAPVSTWELINNEDTINASDHRPIMATVLGSTDNADVNQANSLPMGQLCTINDKDLTEASGLATSAKHAGVVYTHNDEKGPIYAVDVTTCKVLGKFTINGLRNDPDTEAIQVDPITRKIWYGDIGNGHPDQPFSDKKRDLKYPGLAARIVVFSEPDQFSGNISSVQTYDITYEGSPRSENSEALLVNPRTGQGYIITKGRQSKVFKLPYPIRSGEAKDTGARIPEWVTDATFTNDGKWVLIRYRTEKDPAPTNVYVYDATTWKLAGNIAVPKVAQGESITMDRNAPSFVIGSEGENSPLVRVALPAEFSGAQTSQPTGSSTTKGKIDLLNWKVTLPTGKEIKQPQLATYSDKWFHPATDGSGQEFYVDSGDSSIGTTSNSSNPRSELREMTSGGKSNASWSSTSGTHRMIIRQKVTELSGRRHVVVGQIHDAEDDVTVFRLEGDQLWITNGDSTHGHLLGTIKLNQVFTVGFDVSGGVVRYYFSANGSPNPPTIGYAQRKSFGGAYFKAGNYYQGKTDGGKSRVVIMGLGVTHDGKVPVIAGLGGVELDDVGIALGWNHFGVLPPSFESFGSMLVRKIPEVSR